MGWAGDACDPRHEREWLHRFVVKTPRPSTSPTTPRDVYLAAVVGGAILGIAFGAFGTLLLLSAFSSSVAHPGINAFVGATFFLAGSAFILVSVIVLPALRAMKMETRPAP
jgi:hypothetical protein